MAVWSAGSSLDVEGGAALRGSCFCWTVPGAHLQKVSDFSLNYGYFIVYFHLCDGDLI